MEHEIKLNARNKLYLKIVIGLYLALIVVFSIVYPPIYTNNESEWSITLSAEAKVFQGMLLFNLIFPILLSYAVKLLVRRNIAYNRTFLVSMTIGLLLQLASAFKNLMN